MTTPNEKDPDAGMLDALPEFNVNDYATEAEAEAALRARMGDAAYDRMASTAGTGLTFPPDQSK